MTKAGLQKLIDDYGERIYAMNFDNNQVAFFGYNDSYKISDVELTTVGGEDFIIIHNPNHITTGLIPLSYDIYRAVWDVQWVGVMDEGYENYRPDPFKMSPP